ncbi:MAG: DMT family transporter [Clostridia bacterium]|nr:DMT family transporter [Clostridia bacterium]
MNATFKLTLSMVIFGTIGIFRRYIPLPSSLVAMTRGLIGMLFLLLVMVLRKRGMNRTAVRRKFAMLCLSGAAIGVNWILLFEAYNYTSVATATLCYYLAPMFVILASPLVVGERLTAKKMICVLAALLGMVFVSGVLETGGGSSDLKGVLLGLGAAVLYASVVLMNKQLGDVPAYDRTIVQLGSSAAVLLPYVLLTEELGALTFTPGTIGLLLVVGVVHTGMAYAMYFGSLMQLKAQTAAILSYIDPVVAVLLSALVLKEHMSLLSGLGAILVLGAAVVSELPSRRKKAA